VAIDLALRDQFRKEGKVKLIDTGSLLSGFSLDWNLVTDGFRIIGSWGLLDPRQSTSRQKYADVPHRTRGELPDLYATPFTWIFVGWRVSTW